MPELLHVEGVAFAGPLPAEVQHVTLFSAAVHRDAKAPRAAQALLDFLAAPDAWPVIRKHGLEPVTA